MENQYLCSICATAKRFNLSRDKLYAESRKQSSEIPFVTIGSTKKIYIPKLIELLEKKSANNATLFE